MEDESNKHLAHEVAQPGFGESLLKTLQNEYEG